MTKGGWYEFDDSLATARIKEQQGSLGIAEMQVRVKKTKTGRSGKIVTVISGVDITNVELKKLLKILKENCGSGGSIKEGLLELQGDQVQKTLDILSEKGFNPKRSGG